MIILSRFQWYRRARGGYWARITAPFGIFAKFRWIRVNACPNNLHRWEFYPFATRPGSHHGVDEWHFTEPCWAEPYSQWIADTIGTNDMACVLGLIEKARCARFLLEREGYISEAAALDSALKPFEQAKPPVSGSSGKYND